MHLWRHHGYEVIVKTAGKSLTLNKRVDHYHLADVVGVSAGTPIYVEIWQSSEGETYRISKMAKLGTEWEVHPWV